MSTRNKIRKVKASNLTFRSDYKYGAGKGLRVIVSHNLVNGNVLITDRKKLRQLAELFRIAAEHEAPEARTFSEMMASVEGES